MAHLIIFASRAFDMEDEFNGAVCADTMGMGKTHEIIQLMMNARSRRERGREQKASSEPNLLVMPMQIKEKYLQDLCENLDHGSKK